MSAVYLAGPYAARTNLLALRAPLEARGHTCTAAWLAGQHEPVDGGDGTLEERRTWADMDLRDIDRAEVLIVFTPEASECPGFGTSGGRHVETGYALARGKRVFLVGKEENVFHALVNRFDTFADALDALDSEPF